MELRGVERAWRLMWMRIIARMLPGPRSTTLPDVKSRPLKVLFLRYERIGDMIMATGMIRALAQSSPFVTLDVVAAPNTSPVLERNPYVRRIFTLDRRSWRSFRALMPELADEHYDVIVDGRINNPKTFTSTPLLMLGARAQYRVGVGGGNNDLIYNVRVRPYDRHEHYIDGSRALAEPFGVDVNHFNWRPQLFLSREEMDDAETKWTRAETRIACEADTETDSATAGATARTSTREARLLVNLSASEQKRRWPDNRFIAVLSAVRDAHPGVPIIVIGLPGEWDSVQAVAEAVNGEPIETPQLRDALALVATCDHVFTPDTSISHVASAFNKPAVVLLRGDCWQYAPWDVQGEVVFWSGETISRLGVEDVLPAVMRLCQLPSDRDAMQHSDLASRQRTAG
jgi:ADP-heptose:LPS heptosyltransferase